MKYVAIHSEGGLIPYDLLEKIASEEVPGQKAPDFGLPKGRRLSDEIQRVWSDAQDLWDIFRRRRDSLPEKDPHGTTLTRERWIVPLLTDPQILAYELKLQPQAVVLNGLTFPISHRGGETNDAPPVDIEGFKIDLDHRAPKLRTSPRAMVQEFLNHSEAQLWGIVTNGLSFRLLRDSARTARPTYLEFDLESILEGGLFNEFVLFYRVCHRTRLPKSGQPAEECFLERYYQLSVEQGGRVRDKLRDGVEDALKILGTGFLRHPENQVLRDKIASGKLTAPEYHRQLLRLVYRVLFLIVAEERRMIVATGENADRNQTIYRDYYSISRLRERAEGIIERSDFGDLWFGLKKSFFLFSDSRDTNPLGIPPLNGDLFSSLTMPDLDGTWLFNHEILLAIRKLALFHDGRVLQRVNYSALDVEELGSVYESLLDYRPVIEPEPEGPEFKLETGGERKSTGSYYTRPELVRELIQSALVPVLEDRITEAGKEAKNIATDERVSKVEAILSITVCDPACGSGHFLLEAARRLGKELARIRTGEDEPSPEQFHLAVRDVVSHCIYGVDMNPLAVDLCKLALWLEGHWAGKPLSFLDHRIKCGNSLIGVLDPDAMAAGIPDDAFNPVIGDDKKVALSYKKRNKKDREEGQKRLDFEQEVPRHEREFAELFGIRLDFPEETPADVRRKSDLFEQGRHRKDWWHDWTVANLWTAAFFLPLARFDDPIVPTHEAFADYHLRDKNQPQMTGNANALAPHLGFFHWRLEFPEVFATGGFDLVLGNAPWERPEFHEEEHWADIPEIANARNKATRDKLINAYRLSTDAGLKSRYMHFEQAKHATEALNKFLRSSGRFPLTATGKYNLFALFSEFASQAINRRGRAGLVVPTGIATDDTCKTFFASLVDGSKIASLFDFENREGIFEGVHRAYKFALLTLTASPQPAASFAFFLTRAEHLRDASRRFSLNAQDLTLLNPNTKTCPIFRTPVDAELTKKIYKTIPVLDNEQLNLNPWKARIRRIFNMGDPKVIGDAIPTSDLVAAGLPIGKVNRITSAGEELLPIYEGKMFAAYNHRAANVELVPQNAIREAQPIPLTSQQLADPCFLPIPSYWMPLPKLIEMECAPEWVVAYKDVTASVNERTMLATVLPTPCNNYSIRCVFLPEKTRHLSAFLLANLNSLVYDYIARQSLSGLHLSEYIVKQAPLLPPDRYKDVDRRYVGLRVLQLVYTAWDMTGFAVDLCAGMSDLAIDYGDLRRSQPISDKPNWVARDPGFAPFGIDDAKRTLLIAGLDAYFAHLYQLTRHELRYILDPKDIYGPDFPSETFRVLKENEEKKFGEYRTRRLVLAAYDELAKSARFAGEKRESVIEAPKQEIRVA